MTTSGNYSIPDFFTALLSDFREVLRTEDAPFEDPGPDLLPLDFLADFMIRTCVLPFQTGALDTDPLMTELIQRIIEESSMVQAHVSTWRSTTTICEPAKTNVEDSTQEHLASVTLP